MVILKSREESVSCACGVTRAEPGAQAAASMVPADAPRRAGSTSSLCSCGVRPGRLSGSEAPGGNRPPPASYAQAGERSQLLVGTAAQTSARTCRGDANAEPRASGLGRKLDGGEAHAESTPAPVRPAPSDALSLTLRKSQEPGRVLCGRVAPIRTLQPERPSLGQLPVDSPYLSLFLC